MNYPPTALSTLEALYQLGTNTCAEIDKFQPDIVFGLAHSGWMPVVVAQTLWAQTKTAAFPPAIRTNIGREKHDVYSARFGNTYPAYCCVDCCNGSDRLGHYLTWLAGQTVWLETLRAQIEQVYEGIPSRILVVDDLLSGWRTAHTVLGMLDTLYPKSETYVFTGDTDLTNHLVTAWLEQFQPELAKDIPNPAPRDRYKHPLQELLKPLITGTEDITPDRLDWQYLNPQSPAVTALIEHLPVETILSAPTWAKNLACNYALARLHGEVTAPVPTGPQRLAFPLLRLSLSAEDRLAARAWHQNGVTLRDIAEFFGDTPEGIEQGLKVVAVDYEWHQHGQPPDAVYFHILALESWITAYDVYTHTGPNIDTSKDVYGFAEFLPGQLWAGAYPMALDSLVKDQPFKDFLSAGVDTFINLTGPEEAHMEWPYRKALAQVSKELAKKVRVYSRPLPFQKSPAPAEMVKILKLITRALKAGRRIYLHAGHNMEGRTPMVLACLLIQQGLPTEQALAQVNSFWLKILPFLINSPISKAQQTFIEDWARRL